MYGYLYIGKIFAGWHLNYPLSKNQIMPIRSIGCQMAAVDAADVVDIFDVFDT